MIPFPSHVAPGLAAWGGDLDQRLRQLENPQGPTPLWSCAEADLPPAENHPQAAVQIETGAIAVSTLISGVWTWIVGAGLDAVTTALLGKLNTLWPGVELVCAAQVFCGTSTGTSGVVAGYGASDLVYNGGGDVSLYWGDGGVRAALTSTPIVFVAPLDTSSNPFAESMSTAGVTLRGQLGDGVTARDNYSAVVIAFTFS